MPRAASAPSPGHVTLRATAVINPLLQMRGTGTGESYSETGQQEVEWGQPNSLIPGLLPSWAHHCATAGNMSSWQPLLHPLARLPGCAHGLIPALHLDWGLVKGGEWGGPESLCPIPSLRWPLQAMDEERLPGLLLEHGAEDGHTEVRSLGYLRSHKGSIFFLKFSMTQ